MMVATKRRNRRNACRSLPNCRRSSRMPMTKRRRRSSARSASAAQTSRQVWRNCRGNLKARRTTTRNKKISEKIEALQTFRDGLAALGDAEPAEDDSSGGSDDDDEDEDDDA